jgi:hypothetical protein
MMISRSLLATGLLAMSAFAAPPLTTIQDVLYKADGTRFNGVLTISWSSFNAIDGSAIAQQTVTVQVTDGNLHVQLVPTTTANPSASYSVKYSSDGRVQFNETWAVPSSTQPLRVRDVRVVSAGSLSAADTTSVSINESDVMGLISDLGARPLKGPGYAAGRVALVNATGAIEGVVGALTDCVRVDGSSGPCGSVAPSFIDNDAPTGLVDGANTSFALSGVPNPAGSLSLYRNGVLLKVGQDFTLDGNNVQFVAAAVPQPGDTLLASYRLSGTDSSNVAQLFPNAQILCSGTGATVNSTAFASMGTCTIPAETLAAGDRVDIRFDVQHTGSAGGFSLELHWGGSTVFHRDAAASDVLAAVRADAALASGAQFSYQSWGAVLPFSAGVASASDSFTTGITIDFQAMVAGGDTVTLKNYTVVRY